MTGAVTTEMNQSFLIWRRSLWSTWSGHLVANSHAIDTEARMPRLTRRKYPRTSHLRQPSGELYSGNYAVALFVKSSTVRDVLVSEPLGLAG